MRLKSYIINSIWQIGTQAAYSRFLADCTRAGEVQESYLLRLVRANAKTSFGVEHGFGEIKSIEKYRDRVPIRSYDDLKAWIDRVASGEKSVLTSEKVVLLEPTGGSSAGSKLIPYTRSLQREFLRGVNPWIHDLLKNVPSLKTGVSYWSVSPPEKTLPKTSGGIAIGFDDDTDYLGVLGRMIGGVMAVDRSARKASTIDAFWTATARQLLLHEDLALISVWSPTFLITLTDFIKENIGRIIRDVSSADPGRGRLIDRVFSSGDEDRYKAIWPGLRLVSCWTDAQARFYIDAVRRLFPHATVQGKGLLATEGIVSVPLIDVGGCVPSYRSHFLEFVDTASESPRMIHELETGEQYRVVITTGGGLYRYDLGDIVCVTGSYNGLPIMKFEGRNRVCDLAGEKLTETHVRAAIESAVRKRGDGCGFAMLAPDSSRGMAGYTLYVEFTAGGSSDRVEQLANLVEENLRENYHYNHAREIGQLAKLRGVAVLGKARDSYVKRCRRDGQKTGDIKMSFLDLRVGWSDWFSGSLPGR